MVGQRNDVILCNTHNAYKSIPNRSRLVNEDYAVIFNAVSISDLHSVTKFKGSTLSVLSSWFLYCITQCGISTVMTRRDETLLGSRFASYLSRQISDWKFFECFEKLRSRAFRNIQRHSQRPITTISARAVEKSAS